MSLTITPAQAATITNAINTALSTLQANITSAVYTRQQQNQMRLAIAHYTALRTQVNGLVSSAPSLQYIVQQGDTIFTIAQMLLGDATQYKAIMQANNLRDQNLTLGQQLFVPVVTTNTTS